MKKSISIAGLMAGVLLTLLPALSSAQSYRSVYGTAGINVPEFEAGQAGGTASIHFLRNFGVYVRGSYRDATDTRGDFTLETTGRAYGGGLRLFPFGPSRNHQLGTFFQRGFRASASSGGSWAEVYLAGLHFDLGYELRSMDLTFTPDPSLNSPFEPFEYQVEDNSLTLRVAYGISLSHVYLDLGYRIRLSQLTWEGPVDIFPDDGLRSTFSLEYLPAGALEFTVGVAL